MASADVAPDVAQSVLLDQTAVRKVIGDIAINLREDYVFPDMGEQAAAALEKASAEKVYAEVCGTTDRSASLLDVDQILDAHYLGRRQLLAERGWRKWSGDRTSSR